MKLIPDIRQDVLDRSVARAKAQNILLPTIAQQKDPTLAPAAIRARLEDVGLWDVDPANLFRITWKNEPVEHGGGFNEGNWLEFPSELTGVDARIVGILGQWFPTGAHKVGAAYGCLVPRLVTGNFDPENQKAVWPSTGNYCRGGAYDCALLGCSAIAILPEGMSRERFDWLDEIGTDEIIATPGTESNVKEIYDKCHEIRRNRGDRVVVFNQFEEFGNAIWHYHVTGGIVDLPQALPARPALGLGQRHGLGRDDRCRRLPAQPAPGHSRGRERGPAMPHPARVRLRRAPYRGHRRQARPVDPQRAQHGSRGRR